MDRACGSGVPPMTRRLLLFDIDGTLMLSWGRGMRAMAAAFQQVFGLAPRAVSIQPQGRTDEILFEEMAGAYDVAPRDLNARREALHAVYAAHLEALLREPQAVIVEPGVGALLEQLRARPRVRLTDRDAAIDLGGIAKGYAVDRAADALRRRGIARGIVNVGGDLYAIGRSEDGDPWRVGIRSPADPGGLIGTLDVADAAVATSGDYERFFEYRGRRYHHLLDPETAAPRVSAAHSVTIRASSCMDADAAATAVFGRDRADATRVLRAAGRGVELV